LKDSIKTDCKGTFFVLTNPATTSNGLVVVPNIAGILVYDINYKKDDVVWDNKFILAYGLSKIKVMKNSQNR
jgi:hypothetical protein